MSGLPDLMMQKLQRLGRGAVFTPSDFLKLGKRAAVDQALSRFKRAGQIRKLGRGIYDFPKMLPDGKIASASPDAIARAIARRDRSRLHATEAVAKYRLALSDEMPVGAEYVTDGRTRRVIYTDGVVVMRHTTPRKLVGFGSKLGMVLQALRGIKDSAELREAVQALRKSMSSVEKQALRDAADLAPERLRPAIRAIAQI